MDHNYNNLLDIKPLLMLELAKFRLGFEVKEPTKVMKIIPLLRSRLGLNLKEKFCSFDDFKEKKCSECLNLKQCVYVKLFSPTRESVDGNNKGKGIAQSNPPRPFVLGVPGFSSSDTLDFGDRAFIDLGIFGKEAIEYQSDLKESICSALEFYDFIKPVEWEGIVPDPENKKFIITSDNEKRFLPLSYWIDSLENKGLGKTDNDSFFKLDFTSPFQMKRLDADFKFTGFVKSVMARLRDLKRIYHFDNDMGTFSREFYSISNRVEVFSNLKYVKNHIYSRHRGKNIKLSGLMGGVIFKGELEAFIPVLAAGFFTGVGKKTIYGLGKYDLLGFDSQLGYGGE